MGWKSFTIIVNSDKEINELELLTNLGFKNLEETENEPFETAINPDDGKVYIGSYKNNLLICTQDLPMTFLDESISDGELILSKYFPDTEICSLVLHSVVNLWGYSVSENGQKIRVRSGSSEDGTNIEYGEPLKQELNLLSKSKIDENGKRIYSFDGFANEIYEEDQVGENFVFDLASRYLDENLDHADNLLFDTELKGFAFKNSHENLNQQFGGNSKPNKWRKYLLIIGVVIIWQILRRIIFNE